MKEKNKNIFKCSLKKSIVHQCNCVTKGKHACGFAAEVFSRCDDWANVYLYRTTPDVPGTIRVSRPTQVTSHPRQIIALFAQRYPGKAQFKNDTTEMRLKWFKECLNCIEYLKDGKRPAALAFPHGIGCGFAGGDWKTYLDVIQEFEKESQIPCTIYTKPDRFQDNESLEVEVLGGSRAKKNRTYVGKSIQKKNKIIKNYGHSKYSRY